ncbi:MAG: MAC/perforin domain-containing protein, partial [Alistipes sp.]|nr:MAC/perforin domain-containing protein [Alistipes sp.]
EEATVGYSAQAGISGKWPGEVKEKKLAFSGALSAQGAHETTSKSYYEYNITCILKTMMHIKMNHFENATPEFYLPYLDSMANDALNNPNSQLYKMYPNTKEGIAALAHVFGTHVMTSGVFGGRHVYIYGRKENAYQESTSAGASVSLSIKNPMGDVSDKKPLATFYINKMKQLGIDMTAEAEGYNEQIEETTGSIAIMQAIGGDACSDTEQWDASVTPANARNYALIGYDSPVADTTEEHHGGLVELTQFTVDPARKAALEEYLDDYLESQAIVQNPSKMVLADVIMHKDSNNGDGGFDPTEQTVLTSPDGKKRLYTAMVVNSNGPSDEQKHALETSKHPYIYVPDECDQYWLCALDWDSECSGITAIKISDNSESTLAKDGYERRGSCADSEMGWPAIDDNYLCVRYRPANSKDPYVTGFGIAEGDKENDIKNSNLKSSDIFATSAGTEMTQPFSIDTQFDKFWGSGLFSYSTASKSWWGNNAATKMFLYPVYTTQPLATTFKARQIILPK